MLAAAARAHAVLGRRGQALLILGVGKVFFGLGFLFDPPPPRGLHLLTEMCSLRSWSWLWIIAGAVTAGSAFLRVGRDRWGFVAALVPPTVWGTAYAVSFAAGLYSRGLYTFAWYATSHVALIVWASRVPEFAEPHRPSRRGASERSPG